MVELKLFFVVLVVCIQNISKVCSTLDNEDFFKYIGTTNLTKSYYVTTNIKLPWSKALMWCKIFEMELASFDGGKQEEIFFMELLEDRDKNNLLNITDLLYLGASDAFSNESWYWSTNQKQIDFDIISINDLDPNQIKCLSIFKHCDEFQYRDVSCDKSQRFICEYKEDNNSTIIDDLATIKNRTDDLTLELDSNKDDSNIDPKIDSYEADDENIERRSKKHRKNKKNGRTKVDKQIETNSDFFESSDGMEGSKNNTIPLNNGCCIPDHEETFHPCCKTYVQNDNPTTKKTKKTQKNDLSSRKNPKENKISRRIKNNNDRNGNKHQTNESKDSSIDSSFKPIPMEILKLPSN